MEDIALNVLAANVYGMIFIFRNLECYRWTNDDDIDNY